MIGMLITYQLIGDLLTLSYLLDPVLPLLAYMYAYSRLVTAAARALRQLLSGRRARDCCRVHILGMGTGAGEFFFWTYFQLKLFEDVRVKGQ